MNYPSWRYHTVNPACIVNTPEEEEALGEGWFDSPAKVNKVVEASAEEIKEDDEKKEEELDIDALDLDELRRELANRGYEVDYRKRENSLRSELAQILKEADDDSS